MNSELAAYYRRVMLYVTQEIWQRALDQHEAQQDAYTRQLWDDRRDLILHGDEIGGQSGKTERV